MFINIYVILIINRREVINLRGNRGIPLKDLEKGDIDNVGEDKSNVEMMLLYFN